MSEEEEIRIRINSSLISFGSAGTNLNQFCDVFRSDWSENLIDHAHRLGFSSGNPINDITSMLRKFEQICAVIVLPSGEILLKPIADEDTKENLAIIDKTNKDIAKQKAIKESIRERSRMPNPNLIQLPPMQLRNLCGPPPPPHFPTQAIPMLNRIPPPPGFFRNEQMVPPQLPVPSPLRLPSAQISPSQQSMPPPNLPGGKNNANLEPLGQRRPSLHSQNHKSFYLQSITTNQSSVSQPLPQRRIFSNAMRANAPMINDFGDQIGAAQKIKKNKTNINIRNHPLSSKGGLGSQQIFQNDNVDSKYGDEDFWAPPSNGTSGSTNTRSRERVDIWEEYDDEDVENGMKGEEEEWMEANDGDEDEEEYWECESEWQLDFGLEEEWAEENGEYREFIIGNEQQCPSIPTDLYRLIYLFCANGGIYSSSKMDALKKAYNEAFNATFTSKEWNRLLGNEELIKIFKDSFKKCKWPASEMFKVLEKTSTYNIELLPCLTDYSVNPFAFFRQNIATSSAQSNRALPLPISIGPQRHDSQSPALSSCRTSRPNPSMISPSSHFSKGDQGLNNSSNLAQFTTLAVFAQELLFKAKNGPKKPLSDLFDRIKTTALPDQFSEALLASKPIFLGYLRLFNHSFRVEFQDDDIFITAMKFHPISQNFSIPIDFSNGNQLRLYKGDRHKVKIVDYKSGIYAILHLPQIFNTLQELLSDYQQILEDLCEPPAKKVVSNQLIFFLDPANKSLCRGKFIRTDGKERAIVQDIDTRRERFILLKDIFEIPQNFPSWRFPPYQFSAQFIGLNEANLKKMWAQRDLEFAVDIVDVEEMPNFSRVRLAEQ